MDEHSRASRQAANQAFLASLEQLQNTLQVVHSEPAIATPVSSPAVNNPKTFSLDDLAAAAEDIEQFIETLSPPPDNSAL